MVGSLVDDGWILYELVVDGCSWDRKFHSKEGLPSEALGEGNQRLVMLFKDGSY